MRKLTTVLTLILALIIQSGCSDTDEPQKSSGPRATAISTITTSARHVQATESSTGYITTKAAPYIAAEVAGQIVATSAEIGDQVEIGQLLAQIDPSDYQNQLKSRLGEVNRLKAVIENQHRRVKRLHSLVDDAFVSDNALQDEEAGLKALQRQLSTAEANADIAARNLEKTSVLAPVSGQVQQRAITVGSYVKKGDLAFQVSNSEQLTIHLPFPEKVLQHLRPGQQVYLETPSSNQRVIDGTISQLLPMVEPTSRAGEAIIDITNPGDWFPGASVSGEVVLDSRHSVVVPKVALVIRPAGKTVYVIKDQIARQRIVTIGEYLDDQVEVLKGLEIGEIIAVEGAAYLSDGAPIKTSGSKPANTNSASPKAKQ